MKLEYHVRDGYLLVVTSGPITLERAQDLFYEGIARARQESLTRILSDVRQLKGLEKHRASVTDRYDMGEFVAENKPVDLRMAVLMNADDMSEDRFDEIVMTNRGAFIKFTASMDDALEWLGVVRDNAGTCQ
jgi:hypothetical protein